VGDEVTSVMLRRGEQTSVRLPPPCTLDYEWTHRVEGDAAAVAVTMTPALALVEAQHPGHATVLLEQRRPWENRPTPQVCHILEVTVTV
jgi:predicted secreted protein